MILKLFVLVLSFFSVANFSFSSNNVYSEQLINKVAQLDLPKYLLGPGDVILVKIYNFEKQISKVTIMPDGSINLPRINSIYINNLTLDEANKLVTKSYKNIIRNPIIYIDLIKSRPIRININGEVQRPGVYTLDTNERSQISNTDGGEGLIVNTKGWPTIFESIQHAGGLTTDADIRKIKLRRFDKQKNIIKEININYWDQLMMGGYIKNYQIFDGDSIYISKSSSLNQKDKNFISSTNLAPSTITVTVIGEVKNPGQVNVRSSSPITQAILNAGGYTRNANQNKISLLRLKNNGKIEKIIFDNQKNKNEINQFLQDRDVVFVDFNKISKVTNNLKTIVSPLSPFIDAATLYNLLND